MSTYFDAESAAGSQPIFNAASRSRSRRPFRGRSTSQIGGRTRPTRQQSTSRRKKRKPLCPKKTRHMKVVCRRVKRAAKSEGTVSNFYGDITITDSTVFNSFGELPAGVITGSVEHMPWASTSSPSSVSGPIASMLPPP
jgi:hypothetical protein